MDNPADKSRLLAPEQAAPESLGGCELIRQFLREVSKYLTYWNLYRLAAENAKTRQKPWDGGILTIEPSEADLDKMVEFHDVHLDWGVKLGKTGKELARFLAVAGHRDAAKGVLNVIHCARDGGGGAQGLSPIWAAIKVELQHIALLEETTLNEDDSGGGDSVPGDAVDTEVPQRTVPCPDPITIEDFAELSGVAEQTIRNRPASARPKPKVKSRGQNRSVYSYAEMRSWASFEFPACASRLPDDYSRAVEALSDMRRNN